MTAMTITSLLTGAQRPRTGRDLRDRTLAVRQHVSAGVSTTFVDGRPDDDGFGLPGADAALLSQAATWLAERPGLELVGIQAGYDARGRRQIVMWSLSDSAES